MVPYKILKYSTICSEDSKIGAVLVDILNEKQNTRLTKRVCIRVHNFNKYCNSIIKEISDINLKIELLRLMYKENEQFVLSSDYDEVVKTHLLSFLKSIYKNKFRESLKK